jgi:hypothetical protein
VESLIQYYTDTQPLAAAIYRGIAALHGLPVVNNFIHWVVSGISVDGHPNF